MTGTVTPLRPDPLAELERLTDKFTAELSAQATAEFVEGLQHLDAPDDVARAAAARAPAAGAHGHRGA